MQPILLTADLAKSYTSGPSGQIDVLKGIDLVVRRGEMIAIIGPSGVGKSTLLHILGALDRPTSGSVEYDGEPLFRRSDRKLAEFRNEKIGFIFQFHHLLEEFTALENVFLPSLIAGKSRGQVQGRAESLLGSVGLTHRLLHRPSELSGGEQQRVAFARALMNDPPLLLADEPSGNLDSAAAGELHKLLWQLTRKEGRTIIVVTHNLQLARLADKVIKMQDGRIFEEEPNGL